MIILRASPKKTHLLIREAVRVLKRGGVIAFPTETTYGLGCDPRDAKAVAKIFKIKGRDEGKPLQLIAANDAQVRRVATLTNEERRLSSRHWPGPLTMLVRQNTRSKLAAKVSPKKTVGIRITPAVLAREIALAFGHPIAATSANRSGHTPAFSGRGVVRAFHGLKHQPDLVIDVGSLPRRRPSTVARVKSDGTVEVLRKGGVRL